MPFPWSKTVDPGVTRADMLSLVERLDRVAAVLEAHVQITAEHGMRLASMPADVLAEVRSATAAAMSAAGLALRRKIFEEISKWAWRIGLGYLGVQALDQLNTLANTLSIGGGAH